MNNEEIYNLVVQPQEKWLTRDNIYDLANLSRSFDLTGIALDIGLGGATSACTIALASNNFRKVYSIGPDSAQVAFDTIIKSGMQGRVFAAPGSSDDFFKSWETPIDFAFVDGLHEHEAVKKDGENCLNILVPNGILAFHDYDLYNTVGAGINEFFEANKDKLDKILHHSNLIAFKRK